MRCWTHQLLVMRIVSRVHLIFCLLQLVVALCVAVLLIAFLVLFFIRRLVLRQVMEVERRNLYVLDVLEF